MSSSFSFGRRTVLLTLGLSVLGIHQARAGTLLVPQQYPSIQAAVNAALPGDVVEVAAGVWGERILIRKDLELRAPAGPELTTIDGQNLGSVLRIFGSRVTVDGFTLTGGRGGNGGALHIASDSSGRSVATVRNCVAKGNQGYAGGALYVSRSYARIEDSELSANTAITGGAAYASAFSTIRMERSRVHGNAASGMGGGIFVGGLGHGISVDTSFTANYAGTHGGGVAVQGYCSVVNAFRTTVTDNVAEGDGGGVYDRNNVRVCATAARFTNSLIARNQAARGGGIGLGYDGGTVLWASTVTANTAPLGAGVFYDGDQGAVRAMSSIIWGNSSPPVLSGPGVNITWTDVAGGWPDTGNLDLDPLFVDPAAGDYRLSSGSPCIDAGQPVNSGFGLDLDGVPRPQGEQWDMGAYEALPPLPVEVGLNLEPDTLNLCSNGLWITAYMSLPEPYVPADVDVASVLLEEQFPVVHSDVQGNLLMLKFDRAAVIEHLDPAQGSAAFVVTGALPDAELAGSDIVSIINSCN